MPTELKKLAARSASATVKRFEPARVRRQQRALLYGGGAAVTVFILACAVLIVLLDVSDFLARARSAFLGREAELHAELQVANALLTHHADSIEMFERTDPRATPAQLRRLDDAHGRLIVSGRAGLPSTAVLADLTRDRGAAAYSRYVALLFQQTDMIAVSMPHTINAGLSAYLIGTHGDFIGIVGVQPVGRLAGRLDAIDMHALIRSVEPRRGIGVPLRTIDGRDDALLDTRDDTLLGRPVWRLSRPVRDASGQPIAWLVINTRAQVGTIMKPDYADDAHALVDARGTVAVGAPVEAALVERALAFARAPGDVRAAVHRVGTRFVIGDRLPESDLVFVTTFSWRSIVEALAVPLGVTAGAALFAIAALWLAIVAFDRRALRPAYRRAIRLIESDALNRALIRTAPAGLALLSLADGDDIVSNETMARYERLASGAPLGKRLWRAYREQRDAGGYAKVVTCELPIDPDRADTPHVVANIMRTRYRGVDALLCTLTDITARKQMEQKLHEARVAAESANKAKSTFLATMSHEIRTPLNAIVGNLELMARAPLAPTERRRLDTIASSSDALLRIIDDVLDLSKAESNQMTIERIPFDVRDVLDDVAAFYRPLASAKGLELTCRVAPELADGYVGDPVRLRQIVSNLVDNAIKFTERGSVSIDAQRVVRGAGGARVEIRVADTGIGIPADSLPTLFDVYIQADASIYRRFGGTGLGLPLCRRIAMLMHGDLTVDSREGEGTTMCVTLPLPEAPPNWRAAQPGTTAQAAPGSADVARDAAPIRVLVAEDHPASRALLRDQLEALHHSATIVANGIEAMRAFFAAPFDVVLTDLGMPELDGYALANFLREQRAGVPVIAMTAHATEDDYRRCEQVGIAELVLKPLSIAVLDAALTRHAGRRAASARDTADAAHDAPPVLSDDVRDTLRAATRRSMALLGDAAARGDVATLRLELHSMRGGFALAGDADACDACAAMERAVEAGTVDANWPDFEQAIARALARLDADA
ncbi:response regulator [Burkholderia multivorans]|uniref:ATP-binding protein n=1 Tax=Burkholderia multivorans TaxID=87883 RepID=UPI001908B207|nr:ATP-binding protein [Burkholderia multivorans]MBJ9942985.1 response regulator [Burkholderia multivorans]MBU9289566.1 response regulator [Burkholderia multivorans]